MKIGRFCTKNVHPENERIFLEKKKIKRREATYTPVTNKPGTHPKQNKTGNPVSVSAKARKEILLRLPLNVIFLKCRICNKKMFNYNIIYSLASRS